MTIWVTCHTTAPLRAASTAIVVLLLSLFTGLPALAGPFEDGMAAYNRHDYAHALLFFRQAADKGNATAEYDIGIMYDKGEGVAQDSSVALDWLRRAADGGFATAQLGLGHAYALGRGVDRDDTVALSWYRKAADQGLAEGQYFVGHSYDEGRGTARDYAMAATWFRKAADQGNAGAELYLGKYYALGTGLPKDYVLAEAWAKKAAAGGSRDGPKLLALIKKMVAIEKRQSATADSQTAQADQDDTGTPGLVMASAGGRPSHASALAEIRRTLTASGNVAVSDLRYVNGYSEGGAYLVAVQWTETVIRSTAERRAAVVEKEKRILNDPNSSEAEKEHAQTLLGLADYAGMFNGVFETDKKAGDRFDKAGVFRFINSERGWLVTQIQ